MSEQVKSAMDFFNTCPYFKASQFPLTQVLSMWSEIIVVKAISTVDYSFSFKSVGYTLFLYGYSTLL
jgi:hypothetical protein